MMKQENLIKQKNLDGVKKSSLLNLTISKSQKQFLFCPFCSSEYSFNLKRMRCVKCGTIVNQAKDNTILRMSEKVKNGVPYSGEVQFQETVSEL